MLNLFPLHFLAPFAYLVMRVCIGLILVYLGVIHIRNHARLAPIFSFRFFPYGNFFVWYLGIIEIVLGGMFVAGFLTQVAALLSIALCLKFIVMHKRFSHPLIPSRLAYVLMLVISISLLITGAGIFAFDLPI